MNDEHTVNENIKIDPVTSENLTEMWEIFDGIKNGLLSHQQETFHCGTSKCFAGWKTARDYVEQTRDPEIFLPVKLGHPTFKLKPDEDLVYKTKHRIAIRELRKKFAAHFGPEYCEGSRFSDYLYAISAWGLTHAEGYWLFNSYATLDEQEWLLHEFDNGHRYMNRGQMQIMYYEYRSNLIEEHKERRKVLDRL